MLPELLQKSSLFSLLHRIDTDLANQCRERGCPFCGGHLHQATYQRKPRGGPEGLPAEYLVRQSLCCGRENCRRRSLPVSCLFMGRRVYWAGVILVVMALRQNRPESAGTGELMRMFGMTRKTLFRWMSYFSRSVSEQCTMAKTSRESAFIDYRQRVARRPITILYPLCRFGRGRSCGLAFDFLATGLGGP